MTEPITLHLGGEDRIWHFNNYAIFEISKLTGNDPAGFAAQIMELATDDPLVAFTMIVYAGLIGYEKSRFNLKHGIKIEDISGLIATANDAQMLTVWDAFKKATGVSDFLNNQTEASEETEKKKKKSPGKRSSSTPLVK